MQARIRYSDILFRSRNGVPFHEWKVVNFFRRGVGQRGSTGLREKSGRVDTKPIVAHLGI